MNFNVYIEDELGAELDVCAGQIGKTRNAIIREALKDWVNQHSVRQWPAAILDFQGIKKASQQREVRSAEEKLTS